MTFLATGCTQDETLEPQVKPAAVGDEIIFGSRAGFENGNPDTRTVYSGETYEVSTNGVTAKFERIDWVTGDQIEIYSPEAGNGPTAHYSVTQASTDQEGVDTKDEGYLTKVGDAGLSWTSDNDHTFYAMYPSTLMVTDDLESTLAQGIKMDGTTLKGIVPQAQRSIGWKTVDQSYGSGETATTTTKFYAMPDMRYAYMAAKTTANRNSGAVTLDFVPVVTALEVELQAQDVEVTIQEIRIEGEKIVGSFTADLGDAWTGVYPECKPVSDAFEQDYIQFTLHEVKTLAKGQSLVFTVFLRPGAEYKNLTVGFSQTGASYLRNQLGNNALPVTIKANMKTVVNDFLLPKTKEELVIDASHWMDQLPNESKMGYLSLPGTGGSFSYNYNGTDEQKKYYQQQNPDMDLDAQWKAGIRAFEVVVDRQAEVWLSIIERSVRSLARDDAYVLCNKESVGVNFKTAMNNICNKVKENPDECAVVTIVYQPVGIAPDRNATKFAQSLTMWWEDASTQRDMYALYTPDASLSSLRGKVLVLLRMDQTDEKDGGDISTAMTNINTAGCPFVVVEGCGTAKDRWGARGYQINGTPCPQISNSKSGNDNVIENHMTGDATTALNFVEAGGSRATATSPVNGYTISRPVFGTDGRSELKFAYNTNHDFRCWYQEWARVVKTPLYNQSWSVTGGSGTISWFESLSEKKSNIEETFLMAIGSDPNTEGAMVYVNSLCGYLVTKDYEESYAASTGQAYGGAGGDIAGLATELNPWFSALVTNAGLEQATGPTGVIYMDRVTSDMEAIGKIIANNFKFSTGK